MLSRKIKLLLPSASYFKAVQLLETSKTSELKSFDEVVLTKLFKSLISFNYVIGLLLQLLDTVGNVVETEGFTLKLLSKVEYLALIFSCFML